MPLWLWRPCNASPGNYDNNSVAVGVARSLVWGWGQWDWVHQGSLSRDRSRWLVGPRHPLPLCHKLFPSCRMQSAARYAAEPLCLVATGDKARADGRVVLLAPPAVVRSVEELIMASRGKRLSQHNSNVCPLRVTSAIKLFTFIVPFEGKTQGSKRTVSGGDFWCLDLLLGGGRGWM